jgi:hypothetical protein
MYCVTEVGALREATRMLFDWAWPGPLEDGSVTKEIIAANLAAWAKRLDEEVKRELAAASRKRLR